MSNKEFLADQQAALRKSIWFFSQANKSERERWVASESLTNLHIPHEDAELVSPLKDPPDILFRDCCFEIKEILEPGRRRHDEYKEKYQKSLDAKHLRDFLEEYSPKHFTPEEIAKLVEKELLKYSDRYCSTVREKIDLLFYVNYLDYYQKQGPVPPSDTFTSSGWRSVSVLEGWTSTVLYASGSAPLFLREKVGFVYQRNL